MGVTTFLAGHERVNFRLQLPHVPASEVRMSTVPCPIVIALVDDNELSAAGLRTLLAPFADRVRLLEEKEAVARAAELDVVLFEPLGCSSFSNRLRGDLLSAGQARSVVFTWAPSAELDPTSDPVLTKSMTASQLVRALEDLMQGRTLSLPKPMSGVPSQAGVATSRTVKAERDGLSIREREVLALITRGLSNEEIGAELMLSINSIKTYVRTAYRKIGVSRRTQAVAWGLTHGLVSDGASQDVAVAGGQGQDIPVLV